MTIYLYHSIILHDIQLRPLFKSRDNNLKKTNLKNRRNLNKMLKLLISINISQESSVIKNLYKASHTNYQLSQVCTNLINFATTRYAYTAQTLQNYFRLRYPLKFIFKIVRQ